MTASKKSIASMTGFARSSGHCDPYRFVWELKSVNAKGLDLRVRVPPGFDVVEAQTRSLMPKQVARGTCHATLTVERETNASSVRINTALLGSLVEALRAVRPDESIRPASLDGLLAIRGVVETADEATGGMEAGDPIVAAIDSALGDALDALVAMRRAEGTRLAIVLMERLDGIEKLVQAADRHPARRPESIRATLEQSLATLGNSGLALDPARLHQEAILLASRADIREELDRLYAHVAAARALLDEGGPIGRRLDFLSQEFGREANTLCAKANHVALTAIGLDLKSEIEQFREQVQNLE